MKHLIILCLLFAPHAFSASDALDLKTIEKLVLDYNFGQKADSAGVRAAHEGVIRIYGDILPTVDANWVVRHEQTPDGFLSVKQPIPYPPQWIKDKKILQIAETVASKNKTLDSQTLLNSLHKLYFQIKFLEKKKDLTLRTFSLVDQFQKESKQRYSSGFLPRSELNRAAVDFLDLQRTLDDVNIDLESAERQLLISLGQTGKLVSLKTELAIGDGFLKLSEKEIRVHLAQHSSEPLAISQLTSDSARLQSEVSAYKYLPTLNLRADLPLNDDKSMKYTANLSWNIFNGGMDRSDQRKFFALQEQAEYNRHDTLVQFASSAEKTVASLSEGRSSYLKLKEGLKIWEEITASNQQRFQKGLISSKDLSDDLKTYLHYATSYYKQTLELINNISDFCLLVGKDDLFHQLLL